MNKLAILALNYDLLLQYPIHRLQGNAKILHKLTETSDAALVAEETLTNEAFDIIEQLYLAERENKKIDATLSQKDHRLKRLIPLLLYRYRPIASINSVANSKDGNTTQNTTQKDGLAMTVERDQQIMQVLPFNFRPYNTGLCYSNWPLGRTKEITVTTESAKAETHDLENEIFTRDSNVLYVAEPVDKMEWLNSKVSDDTNIPFNMEQFYINTDAFFQKYAPRARAIRRARFRSMLSESVSFRNFLFETKFEVDELWDSTWQESFSSLGYKLIGETAEDNNKQRTHFLASLMALTQPNKISKFAHHVTTLDTMLQFATRSWTKRQIEILEKLLRATVYDRAISETIVKNKNFILQSIVKLVEESNGRLNRAATLLLFAALRSRFSDIFCSTDGEEKQSSAATMLRIVVSIEQSLENVASNRNVYLTAAQLWRLAEILLRILQNDNSLQFDAIDFVSVLVKHVMANFEENLFSSSVQNFENSVTTTLEENFGNKTN